MRGAVSQRRIVGYFEGQLRVTGLSLRLGLVKADGRSAVRANTVRHPPLAFRLVAPTERLHLPRQSHGLCCDRFLELRRW
jgi:hypothetical protein